MVVDTARTARVTDGWKETTKMPNADFLDDNFWPMANGIEDVQIEIWSGVIVTDEYGSQYVRPYVPAQVYRISLTEQVKCPDDVEKLRGEALRRVNEYFDWLRKGW